MKISFGLQKCVTVYNHINFKNANYQQIFWGNGSKNILIFFLQIKHMSCTRKVMTNVSSLVESFRTLYHRPIIISSMNQPSLSTYFWIVFLLQNKQSIACHELYTVIEEKFQRIFSLHFKKIIYNLKHSIIFGIYNITFSGVQIKPILKFFPEKLYSSST